MPRVKAGDVGYHKYATEKFENKKDVLQKLKFYGIKPKYENGRYWRSWIKQWEEFKVQHPKDEYKSFSNLKGAAIQLEKMSNTEKRAFAKNFKQFSENLPDNEGLNLNMLIRNKITGETTETGWKSFSKNGDKDIGPDYFTDLWKKYKSFTFTVTKDMTQETPFKEYEAADYEIVDIHIDTYKTASKAGFSFPYKLVDDTFDLSKYQIFTDEADVDTTPCFLYALKQSGLVSDSVIASIAKDMCDIKGIEFSAINIIAEKYHLNIYVKTIYYKEDKSLTKRTDAFLYGDADAPNINLGYMFNHFFIDEKIHFNTNYYKLRNHERLDPYRKRNVWKTSGKYLKYYKNESDYLYKYVHTHLKHILLNGGFEKLDRKKIKTEATKIRPYTFESIDDNNFRLYDSITGWKPSVIYTNMKEVYTVSGNVYNIIKNCERAGKYLFRGKSHISEKLVCLDFNSMYAFSMLKTGVQLGKYEIIPAGTDIFSYSSAFLLIKITAVHKHRKYDVIEKVAPGEYFVRLIDLKDLIEYNEIEYEVVAGIGAKGKRDYSLNSYILKCYDDKRNAKTEEERFAAKMVLNKELYGYSLCKPKVTYEENMRLEKLRRIMKYHNSRYLGYTELEDGTVNARLRKRITNSYNMAHFGVEVSGYARHILHQFIYKCEDNGIDVFFGFTDSFYIRESDLEKFKQLFPNSIGNDIGQLKIEKTIEDAYFLNKNIFALKLSKSYFHKKLGRYTNYIFSVVDNYSSIIEYGEAAYFEAFKSMYENGKFKRFKRDSDGKLYIPTETETESESENGSKA